MLTARSDGQKCLPYVLLPRKRIDPKLVAKFSGKLHLAWSGKSWMNDEWTKDYLGKIFGPQLFGKRLLVWDAFRCHLSTATKEELKKLKIYTAIVPGGCTKYVQVCFITQRSYFVLGAGCVLEQAAKSKDTAVL